MNHQRVSRSPEQVADALRARVFAAIAEAPAPTRTEHQRRSLWLLAGATLFSLGVFAAAGGVRGAPRPPVLILATSLGTAALAALATTLALWPGRSRFSRPRATLWLAVILVPAALLLWKMGMSALVEGMSRAWPERVGLRCLRLGLLTGAAPLAAALMALRGSDPVHPYTLGAALGAAAGLAAGVLVDLWCPVAYVPHLLVGHLLPIAIFGTLGAIGGLVLRPRAR